ncbi:MAG TPA: hypothetical protein VK432_03500 [Stellaceae bacterium]|nr:hypothetical protein [Stellaceae bacterium]
MARRIAPVFFTVLLAAAAAGGAQAQTQATPNETPDQNVKASKQYQQLLCTNAKFRATRIQKECGPLQGSQFYDSCVASFNCDKQPSDSHWNQAPPSETVK